MENLLSSLSFICNVKRLGQVTSWVHFSPSILDILRYSSVCVLGCDLAEYCPPSQQRRPRSFGDGMGPWVQGRSTVIQVTPVPTAFLFSRQVGHQLFYRNTNLHCLWVVGKSRYVPHASPVTSQGKAVKS